MKANKEAKKADRAAAELKAKEAKEAAKELAKKNKEEEKTKQADAKAGAKTLVASGLKGAKLVESLNIMDVETRPTGAAVLYEVLSSSSNIVSSNWWTSGEYSDVLKALIGENLKNQIAALYAVQVYCAEKSFPKVEYKGKTTKAMEVIFSVLLSSLIIDGDSFLAWADDEDGDDSIKRVDALVQTSTFLQSIRDMLLGDESEEEEEEEIDAPREFV